MIQPGTTGSSPFIAQTQGLNISSRRYLGSKARLLPFIARIVANETDSVESFADIFAGTGSVASLFHDRKLCCNDILYSNHVCHVAWFGSEKPDQAKLEDLVAHYNGLREGKNGYMAENFANTFFSQENCRKIDYIRDHIEESFRQGRLEPRERCILIASLLYAMDRIANTCGHYDAWRKDGALAKRLTLKIPDYFDDTSPRNCFFNEDANSLVERISADLVYVDPPYNSRQYSDAYHLLENVARWEKPEVKGVARKMDRSGLKSCYCTRAAPEAFAGLVARINARYILVSYNDMGRSGNARSQAKLDDSTIMDALAKRGEVLVFSCDFPAFTTGKSAHRIQERLFLCKI